MRASGTASIGNRGSLNIICAYDMERWDAYFLRAAEWRAGVWGVKIAMCSEMGIAGSRWILESEDAGRSGVYTVRFDSEAVQDVLRAGTDTARSIGILVCSERCGSVAERRAADDDTSEGSLAQ